MTISSPYLESGRSPPLIKAENKTINLPLHDRTLTFKGLPYLLNSVLPNVYFHVTTAYAILRHNGVEIGKQNFLGKFD